MRVGRAPVLFLWVAVVSAFASSGCGDACPEPRFEEPTIANGIEASGSDLRVVVTWPASAGDVLPDDYYTTMRADALPTDVLDAQATAARELTVSLRPGASVRTRPTELELTFSMDDTNGWTDCSHPGQADVYFVTLRLSFDGRGGVTASFTEVDVSLGACTASRPGAAGASPWWLVPLLFGWIERRRRRLAAARRSP